MDDLKILECLEENAEDVVVFEFTREIFQKEMRGEYEWRNDYTKIINDYADKVVE